MKLDLLVVDGDGNRFQRISMDGAKSWQNGAPGRASDDDSIELARGGRVGAGPHLYFRGGEGSESLAQVVGVAS